MEVGKAKGWQRLCTLNIGGASANIGTQKGTMILQPTIWLHRTNFLDSDP